MSAEDPPHRKALKPRRGMCTYNISAHIISSETRLRQNRGGGGVRMQPSGRCDVQENEDARSDRYVAPLTMPAKLAHEGEPPWVPLHEPTNPDLQHLAVGAAWALRRLIMNYATPGWVPPVLDEEMSPLVAAEVQPPLTSIPWGATHPSLDRLGDPPLFEVQEILWTLVVVLNLSKEDLVTAVVMFERCGAAHTGLFQPKAIRRFFLGCCIIARKVTCDTTIGLRWCWDRMRHVFTALTLKELAALEAQVFDIVQRRGGLTCNAAVYQAYADGLREGANQVLFEPSRGPDPMDLDFS